MATKSTTLSVRGQQNAKSAASIGRFDDMLSNSYDKKRNPDGIINFGSAENYLMHEELTTYINQNFKIDTSSCTYDKLPNGSPRLRTAMAAHMNKYFKPFEDVKAEDISFANGVTAMNEMYAYSLADEGDGILLDRPIYGAFESDLTRKARIKTLYVTMSGTDAFSVDAVQKYEEALRQAEDNGTEVRAVVISNPHNPLGQCYSPETLEALCRFCQKHRLHLISDEIYALSVFDSGNPAALPFTSILSLDISGLIDASLVHVLYGLSKDFAAAGLRLGCLITRSQELRQALRSISRFHWPSTLSDAMACTILEDSAFTEDYLPLSQKRLAERYRLATRNLDDAGIAYHRGGNAGFFLWLDLSPYLPARGSADSETNTAESEAALNEQIFKAGVYLAPGGEYHAEEPGWFRLVFTQQREVLIEGLRRYVEINDFRAFTDSWGPVYYLISRIIAAIK